MTGVQTCALPIFTVVVDDDAPIATGLVSDGVVDEDGLPDGIDGDAYVGGTDVAGKALVANGDLKISWGADNADLAVETTPASGALVQDAPGGNGNRSVVFAATTVVPSGLTSEGVAVNYAYNADRTILVAYRGAAGASYESLTGDQLVFRVSLSDENTGSEERRVGKECRSGW